MAWQPMHIEFLVLPASALPAAEAANGTIAQASPAAIRILVDMSVLATRSTCSVEKMSILSDGSPRGPRRAKGRPVRAGVSPILELAPTRKPDGPGIIRFQGTDSYGATDDLKLAVNAAIQLQRPLLIKGEPGTGKTMLAE